MADSRNTAIAYLGLGSNLGDRLQNLLAAVRTLRHHDDIVWDVRRDVASLYETSPVGMGFGRPTFLNSVLRIETTLGPVGLLHAALGVEDALGRDRNERYGDRTIDIDVLLYDELIVHNDVLTLPHPRLNERRFVLEPLAELAPHVKHPALRQSIRALADRCKAAGGRDVVDRVAGSEWALGAFLELEVTNPSGVL